MHEKLVNKMDARRSCIIIERVVVVFQNVPKKAGVSQGDSERGMRLEPRPLCA